jgi:hypothetical protein
MFITVTSDCLLAIDSDQTEYEMRTPAELDAFLEAHPELLFSSSLDFPREYTKSKEVLALVRRLRRAVA